MEARLSHEAWVDDVKVIACLFVVTGHLLQSLMKSSVIADGFLYLWFEQTIYTFHVQLFFLCSGFLYQLRGKVTDVSSWKKNVLRKLSALGIPYVIFTCITFAFKFVAADSVNTATGGLLDTLLLHPTAPYWYLYVLFFLFVFVPTIQSSRGVTILSLLGVVCIVIQLIGCNGDLPYFAAQSIVYLPWFAAGMILSYRGLPVPKWQDLWIGITFLLGGVILSLYTYLNNWGSPALLLTGVLISISIIVLVHLSYPDEEDGRYFGFLARYTMPIFLMHTICAAPVRMLLLRSGVCSPLPHVIFGLLASVAGPIILTVLIEHCGKLDFIMYPNRYLFPSIKLGAKENQY